MAEPDPDSAHDDPSNDYAYQTAIAMPNALTAMTDPNAPILEQVQDLGQLLAERQMAATALAQYQANLVPEIQNRLNRLGLFREANVALPQAAVPTKPILHEASVLSRKIMADGNSRMVALYPDGRLTQATISGQAANTARAWRFVLATVGLIAASIGALLLLPIIPNVDKFMVIGTPFLLSPVVAAGLMAGFAHIQRKPRIVESHEIDVTSIPPEARFEVRANLDRLLTASQRSLENERDRLTIMIADGPVA